MFRYNTAVSMVNPTVIRNVYVDRTVVVTTVNRTSYNGGRGGLTYRPDAREVTVVHQQRYAATPAQRQRVAEASADRNNLNSVNHGNPGAVHAQPASKPAQEKPVNHPAQQKPAAKPPQQKPASKPPQQKPAGKPPQQNPSAKQKSPTQVNRRRRPLARRAKRCNENGAARKRAPFFVKPRCGQLRDGALGGIRTPDPCLRRAVLYPAELRAPVSLLPGCVRRWPRTRDMFEEIEFVIDQRSVELAHAIRMSEEIRARVREIVPRAIRHVMRNLDLFHLGAIDRMGTEIARDGRHMIDSLPREWRRPP